MINMVDIMMKMKNMQKVKDGMTKIIFKDEYNDDYYYDEFGNDLDYIEDNDLILIWLIFKMKKSFLFKNMNDIGKIIEDLNKIDDNIERY